MTGALPWSTWCLPRRECGAGSKFAWTGVNSADRTMPKPGIMTSAIVVAQPWLLEAEFSLRGCNLLQTSI